MMCWSPEQVKACRTRDIIKEFTDKHLPWCVETIPYLESDCNCHSPRRENYLNIYAESIIEEQDKAAEALKGK